MPYTTVYLLENFLIDKLLCLSKPDSKKVIGLIQNFYIFCKLQILNALQFYRFRFWHKLQWKMSYKFGSKSESHKEIL